MKSFKDKANKKTQLHLEQQIIIQENQARLDYIARAEKDESIRLDQIIHDQKILQGQSDKEALEYQQIIYERRQNDQAEKEIEKLRFERKINENPKVRDKKTKYRGDQKDEIKCILN